MAKRWSLQYNQQHSVLFMAICRAMTEHKSGKSADGLFVFAHPALFAPDSLPDFAWGMEVKPDRSLMPGEFTIAAR